MPIAITPTLELMASIYQLSTRGGTDSDRFKAYVRAAPTNPIHGYNPMTSQPVLETVKALIKIDAESIAEEAANTTARQIGFNPSTNPNTAMHLSVATPGMWTDRLATEVDHRLKAKDPTAILLWNDSPATVEHVRQETIAQTVRLKLTQDRLGQPPKTLAEAVAQEAQTLALAGHTGTHSPHAAEALTEHADNESLATMVGFLYGDEAAATLGYAPIGLGNRGGYSHAIATHS